MHVAQYPDAIATSTRFHRLQSETMRAARTRLDDLPDLVLESVRPSPSAEHIFRARPAVILSAGAPLSVVQRVLDPTPSSRACLFLLAAAARGGHLDVVKWLCGYAIGKLSDDVDGDDSTFSDTTDVDDDIRCCRSEDDLGFHYREERRHKKYSDLGFDDQGLRHMELRSDEDEEGVDFDADYIESTRRGDGDPEDTDSDGISFDAEWEREHGYIVHPKRVERKRKRDTGIHTAPLPQEESPGHYSFVS